MSILDGIQTSNALDENRIKTNGQVFTPDSIVNDMLNETDRKLAEHFGVNSVRDISDEDYISYISLETTCGNGNFLIRELDRKLERVLNYNGIEQEIALLKAVSSIHGIELTAENVVSAKLRMMEVIENGKTPIFELEYKEPKGFKTEGFKLSADMRKSIQYILDRNILCGNSLTCKHHLTWKSDYIDAIWGMDKAKLGIADSLFRTEINDTTDKELVLTQYDFTEDGKVAIRERTYRNMHESFEQYKNTSSYVPYNKIYMLNENKVYMENIIDDEEELDF